MERREKFGGVEIISNVYVVGASGFALEVSGYIKDNSKYKIAGYFDKEYVGNDFFSPFLGSEEEFEFNSGDNIVISIADCKVRGKVYLKLKKRGLKFPNIIHHSCYVSSIADIAEGAILCPFVTITSNAIIGRNFHANIYSYVAHDCVLGNNVTFAPGVKCNGNVIIEDDVYDGTGAVIFQGKPGKPLIIGAGSVIAAGSVVTKSVPAGKIFFGSPAIEFTKENIKRRS